MKIVVITTENQGAVSAAKDEFLRQLHGKLNIKEWKLPKDMPNFCTGCGICFKQSEAKCHDARYFMPIWKSMENADLVLLAYPIYALHAPAAIVNLFDHLEWAGIAHRPRGVIFGKRALILAQTDGAGEKLIGKDIADALHDLGFAQVRTAIVGSGSEKASGVLMDTELDGLKKLAQSYAAIDFTKKAKTPGKLKRRYKTVAAARKKLARTEIETGELSIDSKHWQDNGWLDKKKPW